jgi:signal transduction histidine kinase
MTAGSTLAATRRPSITAVRVRVTLLTVAAVAVVLALAAVWAVSVQRDQMTEVVERSARTRLEDLSTLAASADVPAELPAVDEDGTVAQIVAPDGFVLRASAALAGIGPIAPAPESSVTIRQQLDELPWDDDRGIILSRRVDSPGGPVAVHVGVSTDQVDESVAVLRRSTIVGIPVLLLLLGTLLWFVVGAMLRRVAAATERQQQLVDDVSHELRSPLARMRSQLEVDIAHPDTADHTATQRNLLADTLRLQALVDDTLLLARSARPAGSAAPTRVRLDQLVEQVCATRGIAVAHPLPEVAVRGRPDELSRAVGNVVDNAVRHAERVATVRVSATAGTAEVEVTDDGPGIPDGMHERIFERFVRGDAARPVDAPGTGLGLAITRQIIDAHGGRVWADVHATGGARIVIELPMV